LGEAGVVEVIVYLCLALLLHLDLGLLRLGLQSIMKTNVC
jgi:hypothetical protein